MQRPLRHAGGTARPQAPPRRRGLGRSGLGEPRSGRAPHGERVKNVRPSSSQGGKDRVVIYYHQLARRELAIAGGGMLRCGS